MSIPEVEEMSSGFLDHGMKLHFSALCRRAGLALAFVSIRFWSFEGTGMAHGGFSTLSAVG